MKAVIREDVPSNRQSPFVDPEFLFKMLASANEIGRPDTVAHYLRKIEERVTDVSDPSISGRVAAARDWLNSAREHERIHGKNSLLNRTHPTHLRALKMLGRDRQSVDCDG